MISYLCGGAACFGGSVFPRTAPVSVNLSSAMKTIVPLSDCASLFLFISVPAPGGPPPPSPCISPAPRTPPEGLQPPPQTPTAPLSPRAPGGALRHSATPWHSERRAALSPARGIPVPCCHPLCPSARRPRCPFGVMGPRGGDESQILTHRALAAEEKALPCCNPDAL